MSVFSLSQALSLEEEELEAFKLERQSFNSEILGFFFFFQKIPNTKDFLLMF